MTACPLSSWLAPRKTSNSNVHQQLFLVLKHSRHCHERFCNRLWNNICSIAHLNACHCVQPGQLSWRIVACRLMQAEPFQQSACARPSRWRPLAILHCQHSFACNASADRLWLVSDHPLKKAFGTSTILCIPELPPLTAHPHPPPPPLHSTLRSLPGPVPVHTFCLGMQDLRLFLVPWDGFIGPLLLPLHTKLARYVKVTSPEAYIPRGQPSLHHPYLRED